MLLVFFLSWFITGLFLIPINCYIIYRAKDSTAETIFLDIKGIVARPRNNKVFYNYYGSTNVIYGKVQIMDDIYDGNKIKNYQLKMVIHKALFRSFIIDHWEIVKRT